MILPVCQFLSLLLSNTCNNTSVLPPIINNNETIQVQLPNCNCTCNNYPTLLNMCQPFVTHPPCTTPVSDSSEPTSLQSTTPGITITSTKEDDSQIFNDQSRRKKTTTKTSTTTPSTATSNPITSTTKSTSILVTDSQMTPNSPESFNLEKDQPSTQITSTRSSTEKTIVTETSIISPRPTASISSTLSTENQSSPKISEDTTITPEEHSSPSDQSSTKPSISTTQSLASSKTSKSSVSSSTTPKYETSKVPEENTPTKDNSDNISSTQSSSKTHGESTTVDYISSTQRPNEKAVTTPPSTIMETLTTLSLDNESSTSTDAPTQPEKKEDRSTTIKYNTGASTTTVQYDQTSTDSAGKSVPNDGTTTTSSGITSSLITTTEEDLEEIFNDKGNKKRKTTKNPMTSESMEPSSTSYPISSGTNNATTESPEVITSTWSTTELTSTTQPSNDSVCDLTDQSTNKSEDPMNNAELTSLNRIKRGLFSFGVELLRVVLRNDTSNVAISPMNLALLLAMVRSGSRSPMKENFDKVLNITFDATDNRLKLFKSIVDSVNNVTNNASVEVYMANKMYLPNDVNVNSKFIRLTGIIFQSEPLTVDFQDINSTAQQLNNWSTNHTHDKIPVFTNSNSLDPETSVLLASVAYFSGNWSNPFDRQFTSKNEFHLDDGTKKKVCTMIQVNKFRYGKLPDLKAEFVELPFDSDDNYPLSMIIMLPTNETSLNTVVERLNGLTYSQLTTNSSVEVVELSLPKFRIESVIDLAENPEKFGLTNVTNHSYDFKCVVGATPLQINHIIQKTVIDVSEGGCWKVPLNYVCPKEVHSCSNTSSIKFMVNQPFIVMVVNSGMILFSGRVNDPSIQSTNTTA